MNWRVVWQVVRGFLCDAWNAPMILGALIRSFDRARFVKPGWIWRGVTDNRLVVLLHGTNQTEALFRLAIMHFECTVKGFCSYYAPFLKHDWNGPLSNYSAEVVAAVSKWADAHPYGKITLIGCSNGGRIAAFVEAALPHLDIRVITVGAPLHGTLLARAMPHFIAHARLGPDLLAELQQGDLPEGINPARYTHFVSRHDQYVFPHNVSTISDDVIYLDGMGHTSLMLHGRVLERIKAEITRTS